MVDVRTLDRSFHQGNASTTPACGKVSSKPGFIETLLENAAIKDVTREAALLFMMKTEPSYLFYKQVAKGVSDLKRVEERLDARQVEAEILLATVRVLEARFDKVCAAAGSRANADGALKGSAREGDTPGPIEVRERWRRLLQESGLSRGALARKLNMRSGKNIQRILRSKGDALAGLHEALIRYERLVAVHGIIGKQEAGPGTGRSSADG